MRKSNDRYEMSLFIKQYEGIGRLSEYVNNYDNNFWEKLEKKMIQITDNLECFASCLSIGSDKLSQWERYGDKCKGFAIGFSEKRLQSYINNLDDILSNNSNNYMTLLSRKVKYKKILSSFCPSEMVDKYQDIMNYIMECAFTKHIGFREEKEFRVALIFNKDNAKIDILNKFIEKADLQSDKRYIDLKFENNMIQEVYIGPLSSHSEDEITDELKKNKIQCRVKKSIIPYNPTLNFIFF
jgi:hypothetical protein